MSIQEGDIFSGKIRQRACALIFREKKLLLVRQKAPTRKEPIWLPPGGGVEFGETAIETVIREVSEETGFEVNPVRLAAVHEFVELPYHAVELYFLAEITGGKLKTGTDPELGGDEQQILGCEFVEIEMFSDIALYPAFLQDVDPEGLRSANAVHHYTTTS